MNFIRLPLLTAFPKIEPADVGELAVLAPAPKIDDPVLVPWPPKILAADEAGAVSSWKVTKLLLICDENVKMK